MESKDKARVWECAIVGVVVVACFVISRFVN